MSNVETPSSSVLNSYRLQAYNTGGTQAVDTPEVQGAVGKGLGAPGIAPDPSLVASYTAVMASISALMPQMSAEELDIMLVEVSTAMREVVDGSDKEKIKTDQATQSQALKEKAEKLKESADKMLEAAEERKKMGIWDAIKTAFQMLAALVTIAIGAVLAVSGIGTAAGVAMVAAGVIMLFSAIDSAVQQGTAKDGQPGMGMGGMMARSEAKGRGLTDEKADEYARTAAMAISIAMTATAAVLAVASGVGAYKAISSAIAEGSMTLAKTVSLMINNTMQTGQNIVNAGIAVGDGVAAGFSYMTTEKQADAKDLQSEAKQLEALMKQIEDFIDMALQRLKGSVERNADMLDLVTSGMSDRADSNTRFRFGA